MSSNTHSFFAHLDPIQRSTQPTLISPTSSILPSSLSRDDTEVLLSHLSPVYSSSIAPQPGNSPVSTSLQQVLDNMQAQISSIADHLHNITTSKTPIVRSTPINVDSRPSSSHSIRVVPSSDALTEHFLHVEAEYHRLQLELNARSHPNDHHLPLSSPILSRTTDATIPLLNHSTKLLSPPSPCSCQLSSAFQPIIKSSTPPSSIASSPFSVQANSSSSPVVINNSAANASTLLPKFSNYVPSQISNSPHPVFNSPDVLLPQSSMPVSSFLPVPFNSISTPAFTMNLTNNFPTFKGTTNDKPIKFIKDFEFRVPSHIRNNDNLLLETVQQVLSDGALTWFGQLQQSTDRVDRWADFKTRFYQRYHTTVNVQSLRTELQLLFQGEKESTLDYFDRLKTLVVEIDPECSDHYIKRKFVQKMRSDIRSRFDVDINLSVSEFVRKAQIIESNIEQQRIDEKLKSVAQQEKKHPSIVLTNNLTTNTSHRRSLASPHIDSSAVGLNHTSDPKNFNPPSSSPSHNQHPTTDRLSPTRLDSPHHHSNRSIDPNHVDYHNRRSDIHPSNKTDYIHNNNNNYRKNFNHNRSSTNHHDQSNHNNRHESYGFSIPGTNNRSNSNTFHRFNPVSSNNVNNNNNHSSMNSPHRYWCPHCQRSGHSLERCPANPQSINYRVNSASSTNNNNSENFTGR